MTWFVILNLAVWCVSVFIYVRALFRWLQIKRYFQDVLPSCDKKCIKFFPRYPLWYYRMASTPWYNRIAEDLVKRNQTLMEYDKAKAEQLIRAEKLMYWSWLPIGLATSVFAYLILVAKWRF